MRLQLHPLVVCGMLAVFAAPAFGEPYSPRVGARHADFTLPAIDDGRPISLGSYRGKKVLLMQFASW